MAQQNQKTIKKSKEIKASEKNIKATFFEKKVKKEKVKKEKIKKDVKTIDEHMISHLNQRVKVLKDISTIDGTLRKDEIVTVESLVSMGTNNVKVIDNVGRFWYINSQDISTRL